MKYASNGPERRERCVASDKRVSDMSGISNCHRSCHDYFWSYCVIVIAKGGYLQSNETSIFNFACLCLVRGDLGIASALFFLVLKLWATWKFFKAPANKCQKERKMKNNN